MGNSASAQSADTNACLPDDLFELNDRQLKLLWENRRLSVHEIQQAARSLKQPSPQKQLGQHNPSPEHDHEEAMYLSGLYYFSDQEGTESSKESDLAVRLCRLLSELALLRFRLVPSRLKEDKFWIATLMLLKERLVEYNTERYDRNAELLLNDDNINNNNNANGSSGNAAAAAAAAAAIGSQKEECFTMIDHQPYYPFLEAQGSNHSSIRQVVARILFPKKQAENSELTPPTETEINEWPVSVVSGGNTNQLFCVTTSNNTKNNATTNHKILVRIFGAEGMIDRDIENATFAALAEQGVAPKYYGRFANGRLEEWLEGMKPLSTRDLSIPTISKQIACQMRQVHARFQLPEALQQDHNVKEPSLWKQLHDWMDQASGASLTLFHNNTDGDANYRTSSDVSIVSSLLEKLPVEIRWLQESVVPKDAKVAFCHNDVLASNVMYNPDTKSIRLIDFEYGGMNYIAFDIANHFNEFAGGTEENGVTNYDWFPTKDQQMVFLKSYLDVAATEEHIDAFYDEVQAFVLADHIYWGLWAVNSAASEGCGSFDYLLYAQNRFQRYFATKKDTSNGKGPTIFQRYFATKKDTSNGKGPTNSQSSTASNEQLSRQVQLQKVQIAKLKRQVQEVEASLAKASADRSNSPKKTNGASNTVVAAAVSSKPSTPNTSNHKGTWKMDKDSQEFLTYPDEVKESLRAEKQRRLEQVQQEMKFILDSDEVHHSNGKWECCGQPKYHASCSL